MGKVFDFLVELLFIIAIFKKIKSGVILKKLETNIVSSINEKVVINQYFY